MGGKNHTVVLYSDGSVAAIGRNSDGQCNVGSWRDIIQIAAGYDHTVGVRSDGTVVAVGNNTDGQCNVGSWRNIVQVAAGDNSYDKCNMSLLYPNSNVTYRGSVFLNELPCYTLTGKLWTRSNAPTPYIYDAPADAPGCWSDLSTPGHSAGPVRDNMGNGYTYGMHVDGDEARPYSVSFQLNGQYSVFSGVCGYPETVISTQWAPKYTKYFQVYGDGVLLCTSPKMNVSTRPAAFEILIRNVQILTITYPGTDGPMRRLLCSMLWSDNPLYAVIRCAVKNIGTVE